MLQRLQAGSTQPLAQHLADLLELVCTFYLVETNAFA